METIRGKRSLDLDLNGLTDRLTNYSRVFLDLGTGDGRYVHTLAERNPSSFVIGVDSCRENLREHSQTKLENMLFVIANAQNLPRKLYGRVSHITINFPWGSLLEGLLRSDSKLICGLEAISCSVTSIDIRLNSGALLEAGATLENGAKQIYSNMLQAGWQIEASEMMAVKTLESFPSTWARKLAHGRDPRAICISGYLARL